MTNDQCPMTKEAEADLQQVFPFPELSSVMWGVVPLSRRVAVSVGGDLLVEALGLAGWRIEAVRWDGVAGAVVLEVVNPRVEEVSDQ